MNLKKFFFISIIVHAIIFVAVYFMPEPQVKKTREFLTQLVTPEEARVPPPPPMPRPVPVPPEALKKASPVPPVPRSRPMPLPHRAPLTPDMPLVPGEGKDEGKPLPEGVSPRPGTGEGRGGKAGEEISSRPGYEAGEKAARRRGASDREKLFDTEVIGDTAIKGEGGGKKKDAITFSTKEYRYAGYMRKLKEKIESIWEYPLDARRKGLYGDLKIRFTIRKDGRLGAVELMRTSGYRSLDDAAIKALRDGEPYWPLPDDWGMESYTIEGHFFYTMYGYGVR